MEVVKIKINRGQDSTYTLICIPSEEFNYQTFITAIFNKLKLSINTHYLFLITYTDTNNNCIEIIDPSSLGLFLQQRKYIINISKRTDKDINIKYIHYLGKGGRLIQAVSTLMEFTKEIRQRKAEELNTKIKEQQKTRTILLPKMNPIEQYENTLRYAVDYHQKLTNQIGQTVKGISSVIQKNSYCNPIQLSTMEKQSNIKQEVMKQNSDEELYKHNIKCIECQSQIIGLRLKCHKCEYNICQKCKLKKKPHSHEHFISIYNSEHFEKCLKKENDQPFSQVDISIIQKTPINNEDTINDTMFLESPFTLPIELLCEPLFYVEVSKNSQIVIIPYQTNYDKIQCKLNKIEGVTIKKKISFKNAYSFKFINENHRPEIIELQGCFFYEDQPIKKFTVIVNIK